MQVHKHYRANFLLNDATKIKIKTAVNAIEGPDGKSIK